MQSTRYYFHSANKDITLKEKVFFFLSTLPHPHAFVEGQNVLANYQNPHIIPRTFPRDYSKRGEEVNSFAAAPFPVSSLRFRHG